MDEEARPRASSLTDVAAMRRNFDADGFVYCRDAIDQATVAKVDRVIGRLASAHALPGEDLHRTTARLNRGDQGLLYRLYQTVSRSLALDPLRQAAMPYVKALLPGEVYIDLAPGLLMGIPGDDRIAYDWHQEINYHRELERTVHLWLPVISSTRRSNGTMSALAGSHRLGRLPYEMKPKRVENSVTSLVPRDVETVRQRCPEVWFVAEPGDLVILHSYLVHRSNRNAGERTRFVVSFRIAAVERVPDSYDFSVKE